MTLTRGQKEFLRDIALATEAGHGRSMMGVMASADSRKKWLRAFERDGWVRLEQDVAVTDQGRGAKAYRAWITDAGKSALSPQL